MNAPYQYRERSVDQWKNNQAAYKSGFETFITEKFKQRIFRPRDNHNIFRILPPGESWMDYGHYGVRVYRHTNIGPKGASFLCHNMNDHLDTLGIEGRQAGKCPICRENDRARKAGNKELSTQLYARGACVTWIVDRLDMQKGPQLFIMPATKVDKVIVSNAYDVKRNKARPVDHPERGYDVEFDYEKQGNFPQYNAIKLDVEPSPIVDDPAKLQRYLEFVNTNPIPQVLKYDPVEAMEGALEGLGLDNAPEAPAGGGGAPGEQPYDGMGGEDWGSAPATAPAAAVAQPPAQPAGGGKKPDPAADAAAAVGDLEKW